MQAFGGPRHRPQNGATRGPTGSERRGLRTGAEPGPEALGHGEEKQTLSWLSRAGVGRISRGCWGAKTSPGQVVSERGEGEECGL